jgi:hypothetical protein
MILRSTQTELISYAYNETGLCDSDRIQRTIDSDPVVHGQFNELVSMMTLLDEAIPEINPATIEKILQFS